MKQDDLTDWTICGRKIGQATGWDQAGTFVMQIYGLVPDPAYKGPNADCISVNFGNGIIEAYNDDGSVLASMDLIEAIQHCPISRDG